MSAPHKQVEGKGIVMKNKNKKVVKNNLYLSIFSMV